MQKGVLKNFAKFTGKHLCLSPFFKFQASICDFVKRIQVFDTGVFINTFFTEHLRETYFVAKNQNIQDGRFIKPNFCSTNLLIY